MFEDTEGQCVNKTDIAIGYYNEMSDEEKGLFVSSDDYVVSSARDRFEAWLANQGKSINTTNNLIVANNNNNLNSSDDTTLLYAIIIVLIASAFLLTCLILKKRRNK